MTGRHGPQVTWDKGRKKKKKKISMFGFIRSYVYQISTKSVQYIVVSEQVSCDIRTDRYKRDAIEVSFLFGRTKP